MNTLFKYVLGGISFLLTLAGIWYLFVLYVTFVGEDGGFRLAYVFSPLGLTSLTLIVFSFLAGVHFIGKSKNKQLN